MAKVRAMRGVAAAAEAMGGPTQGAIVTACETLDKLGELSETLQKAQLTGGLQKVQIVAMLLKGIELGIGPIEAVQSLYFTSDGGIECQSELMRALIGRSGVGLLLITELEDTHAIVTALRYGIGGRPDVRTDFKYTVRDAQRASGGSLSDSWQKYPRAMCLARVTSEAARAVFADVVLGAGYAPGERGGVTHVETQPKDVTGVVEPEQPSAPRPPEPEATPAPEPTPEPEPVNPEPVPAPEPTPPAQPEPVTAAPEPEPAPEPTPAPVGPQIGPDGLPALTCRWPLEVGNGKVRVVETAGCTIAQLKRLGDLTTNRAGFDNWQDMQRAARLYLSQFTPPLRDLKYLTEAQANELIATLTAKPEAASIPPAETQHQQLLRQVLHDCGAEANTEQVIRLMLASTGKDTIEQIPIPEYGRMLAEIRKFATDPQVLALMVAQQEAATGTGS